MSLPHLHFTSISPDDVFGEIVNTYRFAAEKIGYPTSYTPASTMLGAINILFFFWNTNWSQFNYLHPNCILVNLEPLTPASHAWLPHYFESMSKCYTWEYSRINFQNEKDLKNNNSDFLPLSFDITTGEKPSKYNTLTNHQHDFDVVFIGSLTQRRIIILEELMNRGVRLAVTNGAPWSTDERADYLRRSKIALNFHNWENFRVVEQSRLHILFRHHKAVVCELYPDSEIAPELRDALAGAPYDGLVDTIIELLKDAPRLARLENAGLKALAKLPPQELSLGPALERYLLWREQQTPLAPEESASIERALVHLHHSAQTQITPLANTEKALLASRGGRPSIVLTHEHQHDLLDEHLLAPPISRIAMSVGSGLAACRNLAITQAGSHEYISFLSSGDIPDPRKLAQQALFLDAHTDIDMVGCQIEGQDGDTGVQIPERDHHFKAEVMGTQRPTIPLASMLIRMQFLQKHGLRFDAEFDESSDLHFLCKCIALGARFAVLPRPLLRPAPAPKTPESELAHQASLATRSRALVLSAGLASWTRKEIDFLALIYAHQWPADINFAKNALHALGKAVVDLPQSDLGFEQATLGRVLAREAVRIFEVFHAAGLITQEWVDDLFDNPVIAYLLVPVSRDLPIRPSDRPAATHTVIA